jgi:hypothetical protein
MMYRRQLREQLQDHFQAYPPLSESCIPAMCTTEYDLLDVPPNTLLVTLLLAKMMACVRAVKQERFIGLFSHHGSFE